MGWSKAAGALESVLETVVDLVAPAACGGCGRHAGVQRALCAACRDGLRAALPLYRPITSGTGLIVPAFAAAAYEGPVREMLLQYKERGRQALRTELAGALFVACVAAYALGRLGSSVYLVPVPSARATTRARGHDAVRELASAAARELRQLGVHATAVCELRQTRRVADQAGLGVDQRRANVGGALAVRRPHRLVRRAVVVVDDIVTTGATAAEAVRALAAAGATVTAVVAVAATPKRHANRRPARVVSA